MAPVLGFTALLLIISLNLFLPFFEYLIYKKNIDVKKGENIEISTIFSGLTLFLALFAQFCLIYSYIISDYIVINVHQNSHHLKPLLYKITGSWGNHEGSMLLLLTIISAYSFLFAIINKSQYKIITLSSQSVIIFGFACFTAFVSNPFQTSFLAPLQGLGLNPLLQDIGLALHPPMLYSGYIGFSLVFSLAIAALLQEKITKELAVIMQFWLFLSWGFLTLGIGLGSWWAYRELGWGGYWFWDPVENISLMPWLAATALVHSLKMLKSQNIFRIWTIALAILTFILCLIGLFLVRSGLLTSVHSFAVDAKRGFFIILLIGIIGGLGLLIFALKAPKINISQNNQINFLSKTGAILMNNYLLLIALFTVFLGSLYPIFAQNFFNQAISVGASYYNKIFAILLVPFLIFLIASYLLHYNKPSNFIKLINFRLILILSASLLIICTILLKNPNSDFWQSTILFLAIFVTLLIIFSKQNIANSAHLGFVLILIGIVLSSYLGFTKEINIKKGEIIDISTKDNYQIRFENIEYQAGKNYVERLAVFSVLQYNIQIDSLKPALRYYPISDQTTNEAAIKHSLAGDLYLAIGNKDNQENYALRIYYKPFIYLLWLGCLLIFGAALAKASKIFFHKK